MKASRRYITLIELMIVLAIIGAVAGIIGINVNKAMKQQRFQVEVSAIVKQLRLAQNLMLILNEDVKIKFNQRSPQPYWMELQCPINNGWQKELLRKPHPLKEIVDIQLATRTHQKEKFKGEGFEIDFLSGGACMTEGLLQISSTLGEIRYIHLRGSPYPITAVETKENTLHALREAENFNRQLAFDMVQEIMPKWQQNKMQQSRMQPKVNTAPRAASPNSPPQSNAIPKHDAK